MHSFEDLVYRSTSFALEALDDFRNKIMISMKTDGSSVNIKYLQMIQIQKTILAIGAFSLFEAMLQSRLDCRNGFEEAKKILIKNEKFALCNRFEDFICAINVLKHGKGKSYNILISKFQTLPFKIKLANENFFDEGDTSEISTLVEVNDEFVLNCSELIAEISREVKI